MYSEGKGEQKAAMDAAAWLFNIVTSVGIIMVNKALMTRYGFTFATTLTGLHFLATSSMTSVLKLLGYIQATHLPAAEVLKFVLFANFSIVGMNVSLMWNSVGFYQIAKLSMIPVSCLLEVVLDRMRYSRDTKLSILLVLLGVGVCTVTDVSVNARGFVAASVAVWVLHYGNIESILLDHSTFWGIRLPCKLHPCSYWDHLLTCGSQIKEFMLTTILLCQCSSYSCPASLLYEPISASSSASADFQLLPSKSLAT